MASTPWTGRDRGHHVPHHGRAAVCVGVAVTPGGAAAAGGAGAGGCAAGGPGVLRAVRAVLSSGAGAAAAAGGVVSAADVLEVPGPAGGCRLVLGGPGAGPVGGGLPEPSRG